ncbi:MAG TPA: Spy/CpxP family protein refolding chaperone [Casimicrobiaceae bacterium]|nr:Spy/CpxP family protein refolding chaperone [Casimicrobiaceae bacterium]
MIAIENELPSLRIELDLTETQKPLFDVFEREVRHAADAGRLRPSHQEAFRIDDGSSIPAETVFGTIADDDAQRADAASRSLQTMKKLFLALSPEQKKQFDQRIIQALREPRNTS